MKTGNIIRDERKRLGVTQEKLAEMIGMSRTSITKYETDNNIPYEILLKMADKLQSPRLRLKLFGLTLPGFYLDNVDLDPLAVKYKAIEEMEEALESLKNINLINKREASDLSTRERNKLLEDVMGDLQDVNVCLNLVFLSFSENYNLDLEKIKDKSLKKMIDKGYLKDPVIEND